MNLFNHLVLLNQENVPNQHCSGIKKYIGCLEIVRLLKNTEDTMRNFKNGSMGSMEKGRKSKRNRLENSFLLKVIKVRIPICWLLLLSLGLTNVKRRNSISRDLPLAAKESILIKPSVLKSCTAFSREARLTWK